MPVLNLAASGVVTAPRLSREPPVLPTDRPKRKPFHHDFSVSGARLAGSRSLALHHVFRMQKYQFGVASLYRRRLASQQGDETAFIVVAPISSEPTPLPKTPLATFKL